MKKTIKSLLAIAVAAFAFTACTDVPEPEGYNQDKGKMVFPPEGTGLVSDPYNVAGVILGMKDLAKGQTTAGDVYTRGYVAKIDEFNESFGNLTYSITDSPEGNSGKTDAFIVYRCLGLDKAKFASATDLKVGDAVTICGKITNYNGTIEYAQGCYLIKLNDKTSGGGGGEPTGKNLLTNGDFETWSEGLPTHWKSASTASASTLTQSTDAHAGSYSVSVAGDEKANKRLAYKELNLKPGTYKFSFFAKSTTANASQTRPGYVVVVNGATSGSYQYGDYASLNNTTWTEVSNTFTLSAATTICLVVMNPKTSDYATAQDILIDDASLVTSDGGIDDGGGESGGGDQPDINKGTETNPLTVAEAFSLIDSQGSSTTNDCYVKGIISKVDSYNSTYKSITYWISEDGNTTGNQLQVYSGKGLNGADFASKDDLTTGKTVVIKGNLKKYNTTYEFDKTSSIISIK